MMAFDIVCGYDTTLELKCLLVMCGRIWLLFC